MAYELLDDVPKGRYEMLEPTAVTAGKSINRGLSDIPRQIGLTARYALEGPAQAAQIFTEPVAGLMRAGGIKTKSLGEMATGFADMIGLPSPQGANERVIGDATRLLSGAGGMGAAAGAGSALSGATGKVMTALAANPMQQLGSAVGAGLAGGASREAGGNGWMQAAASLAGGVGGGLAPGMASGVMNAGKRIFAPAVTPQQLDVQISTVLGKAGTDYSQLPSQVQNSLRNELSDALKAGKELNPEAVRRLADFRMVPGATPTRGMVSQDPVQITREMNLAKTGANSADAQLQGMARIQNQNNQALIGNINQLGAQRGDLFRAGEGSIGAIVGRDTERGKAVTGMYNAAKEMPGGNIPLDRTPFVNGIYDSLARENKLAFLPENVSSMINTISKGSVRANGQNFDVPFDAKALDNLMTTIATEQRGTQNGNVKAALSIARKAIDAAQVAPIKMQFGGNQAVTSGGANFLKSADAEAPAYMDALNQARKAAADRFNWRESSRPVDAALNGAQPDNFVKKFVIGGSLADARAVADNAPASGVKDAIVAHLKEKALNGNSDEIGKFSQSAYNKELFNIGDRKLSVFFSPEELAQLKAQGRVSSYMTNQPAGSAVGNSNTGSLILGRGADLLSNFAGRLPFGGAALADPLKNLNISLTQRQAQNIMPGLLATQPRQPMLDSLMLPGMAAGGGLLSP